MTRAEFLKSSLMQSRDWVDEYNTGQPGPHFPGAQVREMTEGWTPDRWETESVSWCRNSRFLSRWRWGDGGEGTERECFDQIHVSPL